MFAMWQNKREATATTSDHLQLYCHRERGVKGDGVGGKGDIIQEKLGGGVWPVSYATYPIKDQNLRYFLPYL